MFKKVVCQRRNSQRLKLLPTVRYTASTAIVCPKQLKSVPKTNIACFSAAVGDPFIGQNKLGTILTKYTV
jgi:hypothetical protein